MLVEGRWVHHPGTAPGAHADCNQTRGGSNFIFRGNYMDLPIDIGEPQAERGLHQADRRRSGDNVLIEDNWLNGGNFTVYTSTSGRRARACRTTATRPTVA
ncbi:MAG: hypothetical protein R3F17_03745 [Planctomycetota bacterium]